LASLGLIAFDEVFESLLLALVAPVHPGSLAAKPKQGLSPFWFKVSEMLIHED